jgi:hypothetical protein
MKTQIQTRIGRVVGLTLALLAGLAPRAEAVNKYWIATSTANWTDTTKWSLSSGGTGGAAVPGAGDVANFDGAGGANGNCNINAAVSLTGAGGINIGAGYNGTITQGAFAITVGSFNTANAGWTQAGGTFTGYTTDANQGITIYSIGSAAFMLSGGVFNSTAGTLLLTSKNGQAGSFIHSLGRHVQPLQWHGAIRLWEKCGLYHFRSRHHLL